MNRRSFLASILAAGVAPAAIGSGILMPVRKLVVPPELMTVVSAFNAQLKAEGPLPWSTLTDPALPEGTYTASIMVKKPGGDWERIVRVVQGAEATRLRDLSNRDQIGFLRRMMRDDSIVGWVLPSPGERPDPLMKPYPSTIYNELPAGHQPLRNSLVHTGFYDATWSKA